MNIKERLYNIGQNVLLGILFFGVICIIVGIKVSKNNWIFISIGAVLVLPFLIYFFWLRNKAEDATAQQEKEFQFFLKTADRVHVVLDEATITEKKHTEVHEVTQDYRAAALNEVSGNGHHNEEKVTYTYCVVSFTVVYKGKEFIVEDVIHKDETSVRMHFYMQKITTLYINPNDTSKMYLDLTFIEK
ncbi:hypothetical protein [Kordia jejudonensis]|uniref:hypothetical protein n=1 Tax=Kordia jejudonensis TaxID=1348245 RepID=UPI000629098D|nr:hypothetical protein [Kordia jejudonensis]